MAELVRNIVGFIGSLNLAEKLSPRRNQEIIWFYIFLPTLVIYFIKLSQYLNEKPLIGSIEIMNPVAMKKIIDPSAKMEIIATGLQWAEGPLWMHDDNLPYLLFSDTVGNRIYKWEEGKGMFTVGKTIFMEGSGCYSNPEYCDSMKEVGTNGLMRRNEDGDDLIACSHGERGILLIRGNGTRSLIASHYKGQRLNSPNDLVLSPDGHLYFTDPHYGLYDKDMQIQNKELNHSGVYMIKAEYLKLALELGQPSLYVRLLDSRIPIPNGITFSPDYSRAYVSSSDKPESVIYVFDVTDDGSFVNKKVFFNATELFLQTCSGSMETGISQEQCIQEVGATDGLKVDLNGNVYATGPGGVLILSSEGELVGRLLVDRPVSNVAFGSDGRLYLTAKDIIIRVRVKNRGARIIRRGKL
jgi:gluconolactonase